MPLGRLQPVDLREVWQSESSDFTPWLAKEDNLSVLSDTLGIDLELEAQERNVGPFRADILCRDISDKSSVLIENQLERTDHVHLGQLMTYAAGLHAVTIVWISARFTDEHRAALDWLNEITDETFRFFGLEVELWRIGESLAAPKFNIVSKPNDWAKTVSTAKKQLDEGELTPTQVMQRRYWSGLAQKVDASAGPPRPAKPQPWSWVSHSLGRSEFGLNAAMHTRDRWVRIEIYITGHKAKGFFDALYESKPEIEADFGHPLDWQRLDDKKDCRICHTMADADPSNEMDWERQHTWLANHLASLDRVFRERVKLLDWQRPEEDAS